MCLVQYLVGPITGFGGFRFLDIPRLKVRKVFVGKIRDILREGNGRTTAIGGDPGVTWCHDTLRFNLGVSQNGRTPLNLMKLSVIPTELAHLRTMSIQNFSCDTNKWLVVEFLCHQMHDLQLIMHHKAFGGRALLKPARGRSQLISSITRNRYCFNYCKET